MSPETRLEFAPELNVKYEFIVSIATDELPSEQASDISERDREGELQVNAEVCRFAFLQRRGDHKSVDRRRRPKRGHR